MTLLPGQFTTGQNLFLNCTHECSVEFQGPHQSDYISRYCYQDNLQKVLSLPQTGSTDTQLLILSHSARPGRGPCERIWGQAGLFLAVHSGNCGCPGSKIPVLQYISCSWGENGCLGMWCSLSDTCENNKGVFNSEKSVHTHAPTPKSTSRSGYRKPSQQNHQATFNCL